MANAQLIIFTDSSMNIGGQELQALQQMRSLSQAGFETLLLCKSRSAIAKRAKDDGIVVQEICFRNAFQLYVLFETKSQTHLFVMAVTML